MVHVYKKTWMVQMVLLFTKMKTLNFVVNIQIINSVRFFSL